MLTGDGIIADAIFTGIILGDRMDINLDLSEIRLGDRNSRTGIIENPVFLYNEDGLIIKIGGSDLKGNLDGIHSSIEGLNNQITLKVEQGDITKAVNAAKAEIKITTDQISLNVSSVQRSVTTAIETAASDATAKANKALSDAKNYVTTTITTAESQIKITTDAISSRVTKTEDKVTTLNGTVTGHETRIQNAEQKITPSAIINTVSDTVSNAITTANGYTNTVKQSLQSQITQNANAIEARVTINGIGTAITQNASSVRIAWNNYTQYIQFEYSQLAIYDSSVASSKKLVMTMGSSGMRFFRNNDGSPVGQIVTNSLAMDNNKKGLDFDLDFGGTYMTWASRNSSSDPHYTMKFSFSKENLNNLPAGLSAGCDLDMRWYSLRNVQVDGSPIIKSHAGVTSIGFTYYTNGTAEKFGYLEVLTTDKGAVGVDAWQSDGRLKKNIDVSIENATDYLNMLPVRAFDWKADGFHERFGFVAQELEAIDESLVFRVPQKEADGTVIDEAYQIKTGKFIPPLVKSVQELSKKVKEQEAMINKIMCSLGVTYQPAVQAALRAAPAPILQYPDEIKTVICDEKHEPKPIVFRKNDDGTIEFIEEE